MVSPESLLGAPLTPSSYRRASPATPSALQRLGLLASSLRFRLHSRRLSLGAPGPAPPHPCFSQHESRPDLEPPPAARCPVSLGSSKTGRKLRVRRALPRLARAPRPAPSGGTGARGLLAEATDGAFAVSDLMSSNVMDCCPVACNARKDSPSTRHFCSECASPKAKPPASSVCAKWASAPCVCQSDDIFLGASTASWPVGCRAA